MENLREFGKAFLAGTIFWGILLALLALAGCSEWVPVAHVVKRDAATGTITLEERRRGLGANAPSVIYVPAPVWGGGYYRSSRYPRFRDENCPEDWVDPRDYPTIDLYRRDGSVDQQVIIPR